MRKKVSTNLIYASAEFIIGSIGNFLFRVGLRGGLKVLIIIDPNISLFFLSKCLKFPGYVSNGTQFKRLFSAVSQRILI